MADVPAWIRQDNRKAGNSLQGPSSMNAKITGNGMSSMNSKISRPTVQNYADGGHATKNVMSKTDGWAAHGSRQFGKANGGMVKGYADGRSVNPYQGDDEDPFSGARNEDGSIRKDEPMTQTMTASKSAGMDEFAGIEEAIAKNKADDAMRAEAKSEKMSFKDAFRNAKDGSTFEWEGKQYKKEYASSKPAEKPKAASTQPEPVQAPREEKKFENSRPNKAPGILTGGEKKWGQYRMRQATERDASDQSSAETERLIRQNEAKKPSTGKGRIDTSNIDSKTLLPRR